MIRAFIFDLDGVICDTARYHFLAWKKIAERLGVPFSELDNEHLKGVSRVASLQKILELGNIEISDEKFETLLQEKNTAYLEYVKTMPQTDLLPGSRSFLEKSKSLGLGIALGSASKNAMIILERLNITQLFDVVIDGNKVRNGKPHPETFLLGAKSLNVLPEECVVFEDSISGVMAAKAGKMYCVGIGDEKTLSNADFAMRSLSALSPSEILEKLNIFSN